MIVWRAATSRDWTVVKITKIAITMSVDNLSFIIVMLNFCTANKINTIFRVMHVTIFANGVIHMVILYYNSVKI